MNERIETLLDNPNLDYLMATPEFAGARGRLINMAKSLKTDLPLSERDIEFIELAEQHIKNINPRIRKIYVNGEEVNCLFLTSAGA